MGRYTKSIVSTVAYMIGIKKHIIEEICSDEYEDLSKLYENKNATIIRYLCKLRTSLMLNFKKTDQEMKYNVTNIDRLPWFDSENIKLLTDWGIDIIKLNYTAAKYNVLFNKIISEQIGSCRELFPEWVNWEYIKDIFVIPRFNNEKVTKNEFATYMEFIQWYPYQSYIHWKPGDYGNILYNDGKFLKIIYEQHNDTFVGKSNYIDADEEIKERIYQFIDSSEGVEIVVDCENSNPFKLCGVLTSLDSEVVAKIKKLILFDDVHTNPGWDLVERFIKIPVQHIMVERVKEQKSLVDIKMTATVCTEHYNNKISSFILLSSDSDYWGLISSLQTAKFLVMFEYSKVSEAIRRTLSEHSIYHCSIDDFCVGKIDEFKRFVLFNILKKYLPNIFEYNGRELVSRIYEEARISADHSELDGFYKKYIQTLKFTADDEGNLGLEINK